jgi:hypothetical protein
MWIEVGGEGTSMRSAITLNYSIQPGGINLTLSRRKIDGEPVQVAI